MMNEPMVTLEKDLYEALPDGRTVLVGIAGDEVLEADFERASSSGAEQLDTTGQAGNPVAVLLTGAPAVAVSGDLTELNAKDAAKAAAAIGSSEELDAAEQAEKAGKKRSTVLTAIDKRREELASS